MPRRAAEEEHPVVVSIIEQLLNIVHELCTREKHALSSASRSYIAHISVQDDDMKVEEMYSTCTVGGACRTNLYKY